MDGTLGWLASNRDQISVVSGAVAGTILSLTGSGASAGPLGAVIGAAVGLVITGIEYLSLENSVDDLNNLIAEKEQALKDAVAANLITPQQFSSLETALCTPWAATVDQRAQTLLAKFDAAKHLQTIDSYYALSDSLNDWYDGLFLWAITPGPDGT